MPPELAATTASDTVIVPAQEAHSADGQPRHPTSIGGSRLTAAVIAGLAVAATASRFAAWQLTVLFGWCAAAGCYLVLSWVMIATADGAARGGAEAGMTALGVVSVVLAWALVHTVFTLRYADLYYAHEPAVDFNERDDPDYLDFAYLAFTIGMTYQVSDTDLQSKLIRHTALRHALLSYLFGTAIIAMTINVVAGIAH